MKDPFNYETKYNLTQKLPGWVIEQIKNYQGIRNVTVVYESDDFEHSLVFSGQNCEDANSWADKIVPQIF